MTKPPSSGSVTANSAGRPPLARPQTIAVAISTLISAALLTKETLADPPADQPDQLAEVIVTAGRRAQNLLDVPYNITAVSAEDIARTGASSIDDLVRLVPGLVDSQQGPGLYGGGNGFIIRGLNSQSLITSGGFDGQEQTVSPVSSYFGDIPLSFGLTLTDIDRVEVLRGPQGTLYGSGSVGGTIRFIPKAPQLGQTTFEVNTSLGDTYNASRPNTDVNGVVNLPLGDNAAIRVVAGYKHLAGFIDEVALVKTSGGSPGVPTPAVPGDITSAFTLAPERDTNSSNDSFVRGTLHWEPMDRLRVDLIFHHQDTRVNDTQSSNPYWPGGSIDYSASNFPGSRGSNLLGLPGGGYFPNGATFIPAGGDYRNTEFLTQPNDRTVNVYSADASYDLGFATLTSTTSYFDNRSNYTTDNTLAYVNVNNPAGGVPLVTLYGSYPRLIAPTVQNRDDRTTTEELRISSSWQLPIDYVFGAYYSDQKTHDALDQYNPGIAAFSAATTQFDANSTDLAWNFDRHTAFYDEALFGEVTWRVTSRWQVTAGGRTFWQRFDNDYLQQLQVCGAACGDGVSPDQNSGTSIASQQRTFHDHIGKFNTSFDLNPSAKVYLTYSEGFRRGGANTIATAGPFASLPQYQTFAPDTVINYEIGVKGSLFRRVTYTADVYDMNWSNFQIEGFTPSAFPVVYNANKARSRGIELATTARVTERFQVNAGYSYIDAKLATAFQILDLPSYALLSSPSAQPIIATSGRAGTPLPGVPQNSVTLGADYLMPIRWSGDAGWVLDANANGSYHSASSASFPSSAIFPSMIPRATFFNVRAELDHGDHWGISLSVMNITNELGLSTGTPAAHPGPFNGGNIAQPRTVTAGLHVRM